ncbi:MAG: hypothetical protein V4463_11130 [Pseudomonadota bacterium]
MHIQRVTSLLQGVADVRNWLVQHIPLTTSMVGYDLFLKLGIDYAGKAESSLHSVFAVLPHTPELVREQIAHFERADLLLVEGERIHLSARLVDLLDAYDHKFESLFILRKHLRDEQLLIVAPWPRLHHVVESLYDHFYDLGWLYLHNFGSVCFLMASLVARVVQRYGHTARIVSGYVEVTSARGRFMLGGAGMAGPGQIDGHAMCVIDEAIIVDFGLGNLRKSYRRDFHWALATPYQPGGVAIGQLVLHTGEVLNWKTDWQSPSTQSELDKFLPLVDELMLRYEALFAGDKSLSQ